MTSITLTKIKLPPKMLFKLLLLFERNQIFVKGNKLEVQKIIWQPLEYPQVVCPLSKSLYKFIHIQATLQNRFFIIFQCRASKPKCSKVISTFPYRDKFRDCSFVVGSVAIWFCHPMDMAIRLQLIITYQKHHMIL